ncbi:MAG: ABC transporter substrate-binding protein [Deltaproteobacteria bacterium]|nr:ABC transporter substrate-binding protein [Deltaproteobacteria bacterium]
MFRRTLSIIVFLVGVSLLVSSPLSATNSRKPFDIYMIVWRGCEDACRGFQDYFRERDIEVNFILRDAERDKKRLPGFVQEAKKMKVDLVLTWGTSVTAGIVGKLGKVNPDVNLTDIPVVFMIVADPVGAKIIESYESSGRSYITGTRNRVPEEVQMKAIRAYRPFKRIGLIYNTNEQNSVLNAKAMRSVAEKMQFELVEAVLDLDESGKPTLESIPRKIAELKEKNVDFIYVGSSSFLMANRDEFTTTALEMGMPVAAAYEAMAAKSHALLAVASRYYNVGKLAGYQAEQILVEKIAPGDIPIRSLSRFSYVINMETAKRLKLFPPLSVLRYAEVIE